MKRVWLLQLRKSLNMTQLEVAEKAFIDRSYYTQIENGMRDPSPSVAGRIAAVLSCDPKLFFEVLFPEEQPLLNISRLFHHGAEKPILYLHTQRDKYIQHAVKFLATSIKENAHAILAEYKPDLYSTIKYLLSQTINHKSIDSNLHYTRENQQILPCIERIRQEGGAQANLMIWLHPDPRHAEADWNAVYLQRVRREHQLIYALDAEPLSASLYLKMMQEYLYLMTDHELVLSPFHPSNDQSTRLPFLYLQAAAHKGENKPE